MINAFIWASVICCTILFGSAEELDSIKKPDEPKFFDFSEGSVTNLSINLIPNDPDKTGLYISGVFNDSLSKNSLIKLSEFSSLTINVIKNVNVLHVFGGESLEINGNIKSKKLEGLIHVNSNGTKSVILNVDSSTEFYYDKLELSLTGCDTLVLNELSNIMNIELRNESLIIEEYEIKSKNTDLIVNLRANTTLTLNSFNLAKKVFKKISVHGGNDSQFVGQFEKLIISGTKKVEIIGKYEETVIKNVGHLQLNNYTGNLQIEDCLFRNITILNKIKIGILDVKCSEEQKLPESNFFKELVCESTTLKNCVAQQLRYPVSRIDTSQDIPVNLNIHTEPVKSEKMKLLDLWQSEYSLSQKTEIIWKDIEKSITWIVITTILNVIVFLSIIWCCCCCYCCYRKKNGTAFSSKENQVINNLLKKMENSMKPDDVDQIKNFIRISEGIFLKELILRIGSEDVLSIQDAISLGNLLLIYFVDKNNEALEKKKMKRSKKTNDIEMEELHDVPINSDIMENGYLSDRPMNSDSIENFNFPNPPDFNDEYDTHSFDDILDEEIDPPNDEKDLDSKHPNGEETNQIDVDKMNPIELEEEMENIELQALDELKKVVDEFDLTLVDEIKE